MKNIAILFLSVILIFCGCGQKDERPDWLNRNTSDSLASYASEWDKKFLAKPERSTDSIAKVVYEASELEKAAKAPYEKLRVSYSSSYYMKLVSHYFIRGKVTKKEMIETDDIELSYEFPRYFVTVMEKLKGLNLSVGDKFSFDLDYYPDPYPYEYIEGEEYLFLISNKLIPIYNEYRYTLDNYEDRYFQYPIKGNFLYDENNFWGLGREVPWEKFKQAFLDDVKRIKNYK